MEPGKPHLSRFAVYRRKRRQYALHRNAYPSDICFHELKFNEYGQKIRSRCKMPKDTGIQIIGDEKGNENITILREECRSGTDEHKAIDDNEEILIDDENSHIPVSSHSDNSSHNDDDESFFEDRREEEDQDSDGAEMPLHDDDDRPPNEPSLNAALDEGSEFNNDGLLSLIDGGNLDEKLKMRPDTTGQKVLAAIIAMSMRHGMTYENTLAMFQLINKITINGVLPSTKAAAWKALSRNDAVLMKRHLYCRICRVDVGYGDVPTKNCSCGACGPHQENKSMAYFIQLHLAPQLREILKIPNIINSLRYRFTRKKTNPDGIEDIYDGKEYKKKCQTGAFLNNANNFSFTINTDGCSVSKSSNSSAWPVLLEINELPPHMRKRHMLMAGVWVDLAHPILNVFLKPCIDELRSLYADGIVWHPDGVREVTSKFVTLVCTVDSIARPSLLEMTQFNGEYGCTFCYHPGKGTYTFKTISRRTDSEIRSHMVKAYNKKTRVWGVKGASIMALLPEFDLARGPVVESMHNVFLGVAKQYTLMLLFDKSTSDWYAGSPKNLSLIDYRLCKIRPPSLISRKPRSVQSMRQWTASEWRNWLIFYCLPCLEGIVRATDHRILRSLSYAIHTLNSHSIGHDELREAQSLLKNFVKAFQNEYGNNYMTFNVHLLTHLGDTVENWGPLWAHSAFPFESFNKKIIDSVTSANGRPLQISMRFFMAQYLNNLPQNNEIGRSTRNMVHDIMNAGKKQIKQIDEPSNTRFRTFERTEYCEQPRSYQNAALRAANLARYGGITFFEQAIINGVRYRCRGHNEQTRFCDTFVYCRNIGFGEVLKIANFNHDGQEVHGVFIERLTVIRNAFGCKHISNVEFSGLRVFATVDDILGPAMLIRTTCGDRAIRIPNMWETD